MRKCLRCGAEMEEDYSLSGGFGNMIRKKGLSTKAVYPLAAVCPKCGEICLYVDEKKLEKLM